MSSASSTWDVGKLEIQVIWRENWPDVDMNQRHLDTSRGWVRDH
jgi:hypothetical protein